MWRWDDSDVLHRLERCRLPILVLQHRDPEHGDVVGHFECRDRDELTGHRKTDNRKDDTRRENDLISVRFGLARPRNWP